MIANLPGCSSGVDLYVRWERRRQAERCRLIRCKRVGVRLACEEEQITKRVGVGVGEREREGVEELHRYEERCMSGVTPPVYSSFSPLLHCVTDRLQRDEGSVLLDRTSDD